MRLEPLAATSKRWTSAAWAQIFEAPLAPRPVSRGVEMLASMVRVGCSAITWSWRTPILSTPSSTRVSR
jgi:hypothetical protein